MYIFSTCTTFDVILAKSNKKKPCKAFHLKFIEISKKQRQERKIISKFHETLNSHLFTK